MGTIVAHYISIAFVHAETPKYKWLQIRPQSTRDDKMSTILNLVAQQLFQLQNNTRVDILGSNVQQAQGLRAASTFSILHIHRNLSQRRTH